MSTERRQPGLFHHLLRDDMERAGDVGLGDA